MTEINVDYEELKRRGFLRQRQEGLFVCRARMSRGTYSASQLERLAGLSKKYSKGFVHLTTRQGIEIPFIRLEDIPKVEEELVAANILAGTSGPRLRATTCCSGNNWCRFGLIDTFSLSDKLETSGIKCGLDLPHKFKISISGCPNGCSRAQASDIGIHGQADVSSPAGRIGYAVYIGGCGGKAPRDGFKLEKVFDEAELLSLIANIVVFFKNRGRRKQRLGALIDEVGRTAFLKEVRV